jgi:tRNA dimethylallyltransferase
MNKKVVIICGPTGSGKTKLAKYISSLIDSIIVNADSRQVYKYFDIGTNKGHINDKDVFFDDSKYNEIKSVIIDNSVEGILFDFVEPESNFNLSEYQRLAYRVIDKLHLHSKIPILTGGTGLYIDSIYRGYKFNTPPKPDLRKKLSSYSVSKLQTILDSEGFDLDELNNSDLNNPVRLIRYIEKKKANELSNSPPAYNFLFLYPEFDRNELYNKIDKRVFRMVQQGLIEEVENLLSRGFRDTRPMKGIGYKEVVQYLDGKINRKKMIEQIQISHRQYAKKQITWFESDNRNYPLNTINKENSKNILKSKNFLD